MMSRSEDRLSDLASQIARMRDDGRPLWASSVGRTAARVSSSTSGLPPAASSAPGRRTELSSVLDLVTRAAELMHSHQDQAARTQSHAVETERRLEAAVARIAELEDRLRASEDEADRERARADDLKARSADLIEKTQTMLNEASEQLLAAESRAEQADESFLTLREAVENQFGLRRN